jgi:hypothetical protein
MTSICNVECVYTRMCAYVYYLLLSVWCKLFLDIMRPGHTLWNLERALFIVIVLITLHVYYDNDTYIVLVWENTVTVKECAEWR